MIDYPIFSDHIRPAEIRGVMARKGDTPEYVRRMQQELFDCLGEARSLQELARLDASGEKALG